MLLVMGYSADTCYCISLCHYMQNQYAASLKYITEIIERGIKEHPGKNDMPLVRRKSLIRRTSLIISTERGIKVRRICPW